MKPSHLTIIPLALTLTGCGFADGFVSGYSNAALSSVSEPMQVGDHKYKMLYVGHVPGEDLVVFERRAIPRAQAFCKQSGFGFAERSYSDDQGYEFFCMNPGDKITHNSNRLIIENR